MSDVILEPHINYKQTYIHLQLLYCFFIHDHKYIFLLLIQKDKKEVKYLNRWDTYIFPESTGFKCTNTIVVEK